jgi:tetratricopeptide (TPR) repeat protein
VSASIPAEEAKTNRSREAILYATVFVMGLIPYLNTMAFGFAYDDGQQILTNPYLRSFRYLKQILTTPVWSFKYANIPTNYYRPLMSLEYFVFYQAYGPLAYIYHLANVVINATVVVLLFAVTRRLFNSTQIAFVTAILFAVHPIHTETVAWIADIPDLQLAAFLLLAFWFFLNLGDSERPSWWTYVAMCVFYILALFSKEPAVAFPAIATFYEHMCRPDRARTSWSKKLQRYAPLWVMTIIYLGCRVALMGGLVPTMKRGSLPWKETILSSFALFNEYMDKLVWAGRSALFDTFHPSVSITDWQVLCGMAWVLAFCFFAIYFWRRNPTLVMAAAWIVAILSPALNARWMATNVFAERYLYVPSIGFCWIAGSALVAIWNSSVASKSKAIRVSLAGAFAILVAVLSVQTAFRDRDWRNDFTLFTAAVARNPQDSDLRANLGLVLWVGNHKDAALEQWHIGLAQNARSIWTLNNLAMADVDQKKYTEAIEFARRAIDMRPNFSYGNLNWGAALVGLGDPAAAEPHYLAAINDSPLDWYIRNCYAEFLVNAGRLNEARVQYEISLKTVVNSDALDNLGDIAVHDGKTSLAESYFRQATEIESYDAHAHYQLVIIYGNSGRDAEAIREYQLAQQTDPGKNELGQDAKAVIDRIQKK